MPALPRLVFCAVLVGSSGCTLLGAGSAASAVAAHDAAVSDEDDWGYVAPVLVGAAIGLIVDITYALAIGKLATP